MPRKRKKKSKLIYFIIIIILMLSTSYALLSQSLSIEGTVKGAYFEGYIIDKESNPSLSISNLKRNSWQEGSNYKYQISFTIRNISNEILDSYKLTLTFNSTVIDVATWNYDYEFDGRKLIIKSENQLNPNGSAEVSFIITVGINNLILAKVKMESISTTEEIDPNLFLVIFNRTNGWGNYTYQYNVTVQNKTGVALVYWQINVELSEGTNFGSGWSAIFSNSGNILTIKNESYNGKLAPNQSATFGMQLNTNIKNYIPDKYTVMVR